MLEKVIIIAEAGVNHNGSLELAKKLIEAGADAGVDYVKFQTFKADKITSIAAKMASYQSANLKDGGDSQHAMLKKLELPEEWHEELRAYCVQKGVNFLSTGFDEESIDFLETLDPSIYKIPSGEITNKPYLEHIAGKDKEIILSTGMCELEEIESAIKVIEACGIHRDRMTVLHCNTEYPTPMSDVNLLAMKTIGEKLNVKVGYSDHTLGIEVPTAAVALGAKVIEKHFTLDRGMSGPDHAASLEPDELKAMVKAIRNIELAIQGGGIKTPSQSEIKNRVIARKSVHVARILKAGTILEKKDLIMLRPGDGISPMDIESVFGKKVKLDLNSGDKLAWEDLE